MEAKREANRKATAAQLEKLTDEEKQAAKKLNAEYKRNQTPEQKEAIREADRKPSE